jgi:hypothetical protein
MLLYSEKEYELQTTRSAQEVYALIQENMGERRTNLLSMKKYKAFWGEVKPDSFVITPNPDMRNNFIPEITGRAIPTEDGTHIRLSMKLPTDVVIFGYVWMAVLLGIGLVALLLNMFAPQENTWIIFVAIPAMLVFQQLLFRVAFNWSAQHALKQLKAIVE